MKTRRKVSSRRRKKKKKIGDRSRKMVEEKRDERKGWKLER